MDRMKRVLTLAAALMPFCGAALAEASVFGTRLVNSWDAAQVRELTMPASGGEWLPAALLCGAAAIGAACLAALHARRKRIGG